MRLFIAIRLDTPMRRCIGDLQDAFRTQHIGGNYIPQENLHLTLAFIGEFADPDPVLEVMEAVPFRPFELAMNRVGSFGELWWTGIEESKELENLVRSLRHALADAGIPYDRKRFRAHVTFLRRARLPEGCRIPRWDAEPVKMSVNKISLMRSTRGKNGMIYTELGSVGAEI